MLCKCIPEKTKEKMEKKFEGKQSKTYDNSFPLQEQKIMKKNQTLCMFTATWMFFICEK